MIKSMGLENINGQMDVNTSDFGKMASNMDMPSTF